MITVQPIPAPSHFLRLVDDRRSVTRADGQLPYMATCLLVPTVDDPSIAEVVGLVPAQDGAQFGWHVRAVRDLLAVAHGLGYRRLVANTDGRLWRGWEAMDHGWIGIDLAPAHEAGPSESPSGASPDAGGPT